MLIMALNHTANYRRLCWLNLKIKLYSLEGVAIHLVNLHLKRFSSTLSSSPAEEERDEEKSGTEGLFSLSCYCWFCMSNVHHFTFEESWSVLPGNMHMVWGACGGSLVCIV